MAQENFASGSAGIRSTTSTTRRSARSMTSSWTRTTSPSTSALKTSLFGGPSTLIPMDIVRVNDVRQLVEVASDKDTINNAPSFDEDAEITAEFEDRVYAHFGARREPPPPDRGDDGAYHDEIADVDVAYGSDPWPQNTAARRRQPPRGTSTRPETAKPQGRRAPPARSVLTRSRAEPRAHASTTGTSRRSAGADGVCGGAGTTDARSAGTMGSGMSMGDTETGEFREHDRNQEGLSQPGSDLKTRTSSGCREEEELLAGTRERVAGSINVRKRVRTDRERLECRPVARRSASSECR